MKTFPDVFKLVTWNFQVLEIPCSAIGELDPLTIVTQKAFEALPADYKS